MTKPENSNDSTLVSGFMNLADDAGMSLHKRAEAIVQLKVIVLESIKERIVDYLRDMESLNKQIDELRNTYTHLEAGDEE